MLGLLVEYEFVPALDHFILETVQSVDVQLSFNGARSVKDFPQLKYLKHWHFFDVNFFVNYSSQILLGLFLVNLANESFLFPHVVFQFFLQLFNLFEQLLV